MSFRTGNVLVVAALTLISFSGCQSGKFAMPKMAFWKNDELGAEFIEPPAHSLSPAESQVAADQSEKPSRDLYKSTVPARPAEGQLGNDLLPGTSSYEKLADQSFSATPPATAKQSNNLVAPVSSTSPLTTNGNTLTPRLDDQHAGSNNLDFMPSPDNSLSPDRTPSTESSPSSYDKVAQNTLTPSGALQPAVSPSADTFLPKITNRGGFAAEDSNHVQNPHSSPGTHTAADQGDHRQVGHVSYPKTRYEPFASISQPKPAVEQKSAPASDPTMIQNAFANESKSADGSPSGSPAIPPALLHGQGSYAPGSVSAPKPLQPESVEFPSSGGSFQPQ